MPDLLIELGCEELPARFLSQLETQFANGMYAALIEARFDVENLRAFSTPRRLAVLLQLRDATQKAADITKRGPALDIAYDTHNQPTKATLGFARAGGVALNELEVIEYKGKQHLAYTQHLVGKHLFFLLPTLLEQVVESMHLPARMRWRCDSDKSINAEPQFVRPVRWVTCLLDNQALPDTARFWHLPFIRHSYGHRVHHSEPVVLRHASDYQTALAEAQVIVSRDARQTAILQSLQSLSQECGLTPHIPDDLLTEVVALVEWPHVISGEFDPVYLQLPPEAITATLTKNQRYFHAFDAQGNLASTFFIVANQTGADASIRVGNQRVVTPRLEDARFFVESDMKISLNSMAANLHTIGTVKNLGTLADKQQRLACLATWCIEKTHKQANAVDIERAALLCKADLLSGLVGEFPELQGIAGAFYAVDETQLVRTAIASHYQPVNIDDHIPTDPIGWALALAERADLLVGLFAIGIRPAGDKDPFAMRRAMNGLIALLRDVPIELDGLFSYAHARYQAQNIALKGAYADYANALQQFCFDRLPHIFADHAQPLPAVCMPESQSIQMIERKAVALDVFSQSDAYASVIVAYKRLHNMIKNKETSNQVPDNTLFVEQTETDFYLAVERYQQAHKNSTDYGAALSDLAHLTDVTNQLLDTVTIHADDAALAHNRLLLLGYAYLAYNGVAQLSLLPG